MRYSAPSAVNFFSPLVAKAHDFYSREMNNVICNQAKSWVLPNGTDGITVDFMKTISLKLPQDLEQEIRHAAERQAIPLSEWIRGAMEERLKKEPRKKRLTAADTFGKYLGIAGDGPHDLSTNPKYMEGFGK